jgi:hypothetical protein
LVELSGIEPLAFPARRDAPVQCPASLDSKNGICEDLVELSGIEPLAFPARRDALFSVLPR